MPRRRRPPRAGALSDLQPLRIASQIALLQVVFYAVALVLMLFTALVAGMAFSPALVLGWEPVRGDTTRGWLMAFVWLLDGGLCMAVAMVVLVARSKLVPDFALTTHLIHFVFTSLYARALPRHSMWWATMVASSALAIALGVWGCRYRELQPVFFGSRRILGAASSAATPSAPSDAAPVDDDIEQEVSFSRGRGRGRGRDGAGDYEMMQLKHAP